MATFTISLSGSTVVNGSKSWTLSDADVQSLSNFLIAKFSFNGPPLTPAQALLAWVQDFVNQTVSNVASFQKAQIIVPPVTFT